MGRMVKFVKKLVETPLCTHICNVKWLGLLLMISGQAETVILEHCLLEDWEEISPLSSCCQLTSHFKKKSVTPEQELSLPNMEIE